MCFSVDVDDLVNRIVQSDISQEELVTLIKGLDEDAADWDVTKQLYSYFCQQMKFYHEESRSQEEGSGGQVHILLYDGPRIHVLASQDINIGKWHTSDDHRAAVLHKLVSSYVRSAL